jgi:hypothetical protein
MNGYRRAHGDRRISYAITHRRNTQAVERYPEGLRTILVMSGSRRSVAAHPPASSK